MMAQGGQEKLFCLAYSSVRRITKEKRKKETELQCYDKLLIDLLKNILLKVHDACTEHSSDCTT